MTGGDLVVVVAGARVVVVAGLLLDVVCDVVSVVVSELASESLLVSVVLSVVVVSVVVVSFSDSVTVSVESDGISVVLDSSVLSWQPCKTRLPVNTKTATRSTALALLLFLNDPFRSIRSNINMDSSLCLYIAGLMPVSAWTINKR